MWVPKWLADIGLELNRSYYKNRLRTIYYNSKQPPSWFDHRIDLHYGWPENLFWLERGVFPRRYMTKGCTVLDLFCGDGFFSRYFYSTIAGAIDAVDKDSTAIEHAKQWHSHPKIQYSLLDAVHQDFPRAQYDVIVWFEGIEHLSTDEYQVVVERIKRALAKDGILIGSTPIVSQDKSGQQNWEHQNEFTSTGELNKFLSRNFADVKIETTVYPELDGGERFTAYFVVK